jgi:hypothetical protein
VTLSFDRSISLLALSPQRREIASVEISADRSKISQVLRNFISNALKFTPSGGQVSIVQKFTPHPAHSTNDAIISDSRLSSMVREVRARVNSSAVFVTNIDEDIESDTNTISNGILRIEVHDTGCGISHVSFHTLSSFPSSLLFRRIKRNCSSPSFNSTRLHFKAARAQDWAYSVCLLSLSHSPRLTPRLFSTPQSRMLLSSSMAGRLACRQQVFVAKALSFMWSYPPSQPTRAPLSPHPHPLEPQGAWQAGIPTTRPGPLPRLSSKKSKASPRFMSSLSGQPIANRLN